MRCHIHLDLVGGIAGDMFIAALCDARPDLVDGLLQNLDSLAVPADVLFSLNVFNDGTLQGKQFATSESRGKPSHTHFPALCERIRKSGLPKSVIGRAIEIYTLLAEAEAHVHGVSVDDVAFHEVGAWDSVIDVVGAAYFIEAVDGTWSCGSVPLGGGQVDTAHGKLPVPVPAVTALLTGFKFYQDGLTGERVTPTGAAILRYLMKQESEIPRSQHSLLSSGIGFGHRTLDGKSNMLRALVFNASEMDKNVDQVGVIEFEIDDQTPEDLAHAVDLLRNTTGVIDVIQWTFVGKKGRLGIHVQVLTQPLALNAVTEACLTETTTIGVRSRLESRRILVRETVPVNAVAGVGGSVRVKLVELPGGGQGAKAESDDLRDVPGGHEGRRVARGQAEEKARDTKKM